MPQVPLGPAPLPDDSPPPIDERPPYGDVPRWPLAVLAAVVLAVLVVLAVVVSAARRLRAAAPVPVGLVMYPDPEQPCSGVRYRAEFYDGTYPQLTDRPLFVVLPALHGPAADAALDRLAWQLAAEVEQRDGQRCFAPRLVVYGAAGVRRSWSAAL